MWWTTQVLVPSPLPIYSILQYTGQHGTAMGWAAWQSCGLRGSAPPLSVA